MTRRIFTCCEVPIYAALKDGWDTDSREMDFWFSLANEDQESYENGMFDIRTVSPSINQGGDYRAFLDTGDRKVWLKVVKAHIETALLKGNLRSQATTHPSQCQYPLQTTQSKQCILYFTAQNFLRFAKQT